MIIAISNFAMPIPLDSNIMFSNSVPTLITFSKARNIGSGFLMNHDVSFFATCGAAMLIKFRDADDDWKSGERNNDNQLKIKVGASTIIHNIFNLLNFICV